MVLSAPKHVYLIESAKVPSQTVFSSFNKTVLNETDIKSSNQTLQQS